MLLNRRRESIGPLEAAKVVLEVQRRFSVFDPDREEWHLAPSGYSHLVADAARAIRRCREKHNDDSASDERLDDRPIPFCTGPYVARRDPAREVLGLQPGADGICRL